MVNEDGTFVRGPVADSGDEGNEGGGEVKKRSTMVRGQNGEASPDTLFLGRRAPQFNATVLKGRPLF